MKVLNKVITRFCYFVLFFFAFKEQENIQMGNTMQSLVVQQISFFHKSVMFLSSEFHSHTQNVQALHQSEAMLLWWAICSCKHGGQYGRSEYWRERNAGNGTFVVLYCAIFHKLNFHKSLKFFGTSIASLDPETVELPAFSILSAMFTGACDPPEKLSLTLVQRLNVNVKWL